MTSCVRSIKLSSVVILTLLAAAPLLSQTSSGTRSSQSAASGTGAPSIAEIRAIMAKLQRSEFPTPQEAMRMMQFFQTAGSLSSPSPQLLDAIAPLYEHAPSDIKQIVSSLRAGHKATPAEASKLQAFTTQAFFSGALAGLAVGVPGGVPVNAPATSAPATPARPTTVAVSKKAVDAGSSASHAPAAAPADTASSHPIPSGLPVSTGLLNSLMAAANGSQVESAAAAIGSAVCPAPSQHTSHALSASPPTAKQLASTLDGIIQRSAQAEDPAARATLTNLVASSSSPAHAAQLGAILWMSGASNGGAYALASAAKRSSDANTLTNLGAALNSRGDYADAAIVLRAALAKDPTLAPALNNLAVAMANLGDLRGAERTLQQALQTAPGFSEARFSLGRVLECEGDMAHALETMRRALEEQPSHGRQQFLMAVWRTTTVPMVDAVFNTDPDATDADAGSAGSDASQPTNRPHIDGALTALPLPGTVAGYATLAVKQHAINDIEAHVSEQTKRYMQEKTEYEAMLPQTSDRTPVHRGGTTVIPISDDGIRDALEQAWDGAYAKQQAVDKRSAPVLSDIDHAMDVANDRAGDVIVQGGHPCSVLLPAVTTQYGKFLGVHNSTVMAMNGIARDYAAQASRLIDRLHDPVIAAIEEANVRLNLLDLQGYIDTETMTFSPNTLIVLQLCPSSAERQAVPKPKLQDVRRPGPCKTLLQGKAIVLEIKIDCHSVTLSGGEGLLGELKYDIHTHSGELFLGAGIKAEGPGLYVGSAGIGPKVFGLGAKLGVTLAFDGSGNFTDAGFTSAAEGNIIGLGKFDLSQTNWAVNGMEFSPDVENLTR